MVVLIASLIDCCSIWCGMCPLDRAAETGVFGVVALVADRGNSISSLPICHQFLHRSTP